MERGDEATEDDRMLASAQVFSDMQLLTHEVGVECLGLAVQMWMHTHDVPIMRLSKRPATRASSSFHLDMPGLLADWQKS